MTFHTNDWNHRDIHEVLTDLVDTLKIEKSLYAEQLILSLVQEIKVAAHRLQAHCDYSDDIQVCIDRRDVLNEEIKALQTKLDKGDD